jgi:hypothetical protein
MSDKNTIIQDFISDFLRDIHPFCTYSQQNGSMMKNGNMY